MMQPNPRRRPTERTADHPRNAPVVLRKELNALGYHDRAIAAMVRRGQLARVRRGAYASGPVVAGLDEAGRYGLVSRAAVKQAKTDVVLSHVSAAAEYDAPMWGLDLRETHLTRTDGRTGRREAGIAQHCGRSRTATWSSATGCSS
ncbi:hypothetical protein GCM10023340_17300 [Nocardioides marinquilinus]|uniref:AbiEi antitoxin N-terminal domain-containing protein n=1 Tax=Nocardioides marinquilinus TaxID=1210400 RepID=A0ABP9PIV4_9ACTN